MLIRHLASAAGDATAQAWGAGLAQALYGGGETATAATSALAGAISKYNCAQVKPLLAGVASFCRARP